LVALVATLAHAAQPPSPSADGAPALDPAVKAAITAPYLKPDEAAALRVSHGVPTADDLKRPAARAAHALIRGAYTDPALADTTADPLDRAEAAIARGDTGAAAALLKDSDSARALRLRAQLAFTLGHNEQGIADARRAVARLAAGSLTAPDDAVEGVLAAAMLARYTDTSASNGGDHQAMMAFLAKARESDPLSWRIPLAEAQLLADKDNYDQARAAALEALARNPACAPAYALLGDLAVVSFNLDLARTLADRLDRLASMQPLDDGADDLDLILAKAQPSVEAAAIRARASLRQNDPEEAAGELAYAARRMPDAPLAAEIGCALAAATYDPAKLDAVLAAFRARFGASAAAEARVGQVLCDLRQYDAAIAHLHAARALAPFWPNPQVDLGLVLVQAARDDEARATLESATKLDPFNVRAANSLKLVTEVAAYARVETPHFVVRAKPGLDALLAQEVAVGMEENFRAVTGSEPGALNYAPPHKTFIDLMPDHPWFAVRIAGLPKIHTIAASTGPVIAMEVPREGPKHTGVYDWPRVLRHEYTHTVGLSRTGNRMPHWFTEAQAQYLELAPRDYSTARLLAETVEEDGLFDFTSINTAFTRPKKPTDRQLAYAQGQWMYEYLVERFGPDAPLKLMDLFAKGVREEAAIQQSFSITREQFLADFKQWARVQLISWGMLTPPGQPSLESLIKALPRTEEGDDPTPTPDQLAGWLRDHPANADVLRLALQAAVDERAGQFTDDDLALFDRYAAARPVDPFPHQQLARFFLAKGEPQRAIPHLEWLDARETMSPVYATQLAGLYAQAGDMDKAAAGAERAARIAPYTAQARELAATIAVQRKDFAAARRHLTFLAALEPDRDVHTRRLEALKKLEAAQTP